MGQTKRKRRLSAWRAKKLHDAQHKRRKRHYGPDAPFGGRHSGNYKMVDRFENMRVDVYGNDHAPPHFHVSATGGESMYTILECAFMRGKLRLYYHELHDWWLDHRLKVAEMWNEMHPTGTHPGPVRIPKNWHEKT